MPSTTVRQLSRCCASTLDVALLAVMLLYSMFNKDFEIFGNVFPASKEDYDHIHQFSQKVPQLLELGLLKPMKVKLWEGGLGKVAEGLAHLEEGKVNAEKLVIKM